MTTSAPNATPSPNRDGDPIGGAGDKHLSPPDLLVSRPLAPRFTVASVS